MDEWENELQKISDGIQKLRVPVNDGRVQAILLCAGDKIKTGKFVHKTISNPSNFLYQLNFEDGTKTELKIGEFKSLLHNS